MHVFRTNNDPSKAPKQFQYPRNRRGGVSRAFNGCYHYVRFYKEIVELDEPLIITQRI